MYQNSEIYLRTPIISDLDFILEMENDPEIWAVSQTTEAFSRGDIENFIINNAHDLYKDLQIRFVVIMKENDIPIGSIDLFNYNADEDSGQVGITILSQFRGFHLGTKALDLLIEKSFKELGLNKLSCTVFTDNIPSIKLFESCGFKRLKLLKGNTDFKGKKYDEYLYQINKSGK